MSKFVNELVNESVNTSAKTRPAWQNRLAPVLRRFPWTGRILRRVMSVIQPRFTIGVVGVLLDDTRERVFLVEHLFHPRFPWGLPGGWIDRGEEPAHTVVREFREETNLKVRAVRPLLTQLSPVARRHLDIVYLCELDGSESDGTQAVRLSGELLDYRWVARDELPVLIPFHESGISAAFALLDGVDAPVDPLAVEALRAISPARRDGAADRDGRS